MAHVIKYILGFLMVSHIAHAGVKRDQCMLSRWPFSKNLSPVKFQKIVEHIDRSTLRHYLFYEVVNEKTPQLAREIYHYLKTTEGDSNLQGFYELLFEAGHLSENKIQTISEKELCSLYKKVIEIK